MDGQTDFIQGKDGKKVHNGNFFWKILQLILCFPALQKLRLLFYFYDCLVLWGVRKAKKRKTEKKQILLVFPLSLGDSILFLGSLPCIRRIWPAAQHRLSLTCHTEYAALFSGYFDEVIAVDYRRASVDPLYRARFCRSFRKRYFDLAVDPVGCEACSPNVFVMHAVSAGEKIGAISASDQKFQCPAWMQRRIYTKILCNTQKNLHKVRYYAWFWSELGRRHCEPALARFSYPGRADLPARYVVIAASASTQVKQWPAERFAEIARRIWRLTGHALVLCGTARDRAVTERFLQELRDEAPYYDLVGQTSVTELIGVIGKAELVVTNDTGAYHIAVAQRRKVCVVTGGYVYDMFIDYGCRRYGCPEPAVVCPKWACANCGNHCVYRVKGIYPCVEHNTVEDVWSGVLRLLEDTK